MRLLVDEDTAVQVLEPLRHVLLGHQVDHVSGVSWKGKKDRQVLPEQSAQATTRSSRATAPSSATPANATRSRNPAFTTFGTLSARRECEAWGLPLAP